MRLDKKRILLIMPKFFGYEMRIQKELESQGAIVTLVFENVDELNVVYRLIYVYAKKTKEIFLRWYYRSKMKGRFDYVILIRGSNIPEEVIKEFKCNNKDAKFIMYQWDSVANTPNALKIMKEFHYIATFDMKDAETYQWAYRPLFFCDETSPDHNKQIDLLLIGSLHSKRTQLLMNIKRFVSKKNLCLFHYLYCKRMIYYKQKYLNHNDVFSGMNNSEIKFKALSLEETQKAYGDSKIVVDLANPNQNGLTMRSIECIGHKCKLATNNRNIVDSDFYNKNNVYIYDIDSFELPDWFIKSPYEELNKEIYDKYSIKSWIDSLLENS